MSCLAVHHSRCYQIKAGRKRSKNAHWDRGPPTAQQKRHVHSTPRSRKGAVGSLLTCVEQRWLSFFIVHCSTRALRKATKSECWHGRPRITAAA